MQINTQKEFIMLHSTTLFALCASKKMSFPQQNKLYILSNNKCIVILVWNILTGYLVTNFDQYVLNMFFGWYLIWILRLLMRVRRITQVYLVRPFVTITEVIIDQKGSVHLLIRISCYYFAVPSIPLYWCKTI